MIMTYILSFLTVPFVNHHILVRPPGFHGRPPAAPPPVQNEFDTRSIYQGITV